MLSVNFNLYSMPQVSFQSKYPKIKDMELFEKLILQGMSQKEIADYFGTSIPTVNRIRNKMGIPRIHKFKMAAHEKVVLERLHEGSSINRKELAKELGVSKGTIDRIAQANNIRQISRKNQENKIMELINAGLLPTDIAQTLGVSISTITRIVSRLGLEVKRPTHDAEVIKRFMEGKNNKQIASEVGISEYIVAKIKRKNGLSKVYNRLEGPQIFTWTEIVEDSKQVTKLRQLFARFKKGERGGYVIEEMSKTVKQLNEIVDNYKKRFEQKRRYN